MSKVFSKVGVIGAGVMGAGVATDLAFNGIEVVLVDVGEKQLAGAKAEIVKTTKYAHLYGRKNDAEEVLDKVCFTTDLAAVRDCEFIVENVVEQWEVKKEVYTNLDRICPPQVCFGMNTSCIPITQAGSVVSRPDKIVGVHFMNPVLLKKTVEAIRGVHTSDDTLAALLGLLAQLGKKAIVVNDFPGFVSNRISHLFMNEAALVVQDQVATPKQVDDIFKKCFGHAMGPLETADLIGLDTVVQSIDVLFDSYKDSKFRCCPMLRKMVQAGQLGRKSGKGFYEYKY